MNMSCCFRVADFIRRSCRRSGIPQLMIGCNIPDKQQRGLIPCSSSLKGYCNLSDGLESESPGITSRVVNLANRVEQSVKLNNTWKGRVMLIDGTYMIYRAYYKILARLDRDHYWNADGNGDWVYTISRALSLILDVLELGPSHVAVVFDHDGVPLGRASASFRENYNGKGTNFRHILYPSYKGHRNATPDTVIQGLQYFKLSLRAMSIPVIQVPGVEADDVIGTLAVNSVADGFKVRVVSPDRDFFQLISPAVRLLRIASRGSEMVSFGVEEFAERYGDLKPSQFIDMVSLLGDKTDNIPEVNGIEDADALKLIIKFGTLENLLKCVDQVEEECIKKALVSNADQAILNKNLLMLRSDLPFHKVPFRTSDLLFRKPKDDGEKFRNLLTAISAYAEGHSAEHLIRKADNLWKQHTTASYKQ
ncbi:uncharacterized protein LOC113284548 isoform X2 [Papaver somniferum]|uniref:uncharacterized protein LOC113284548 isoform X2 n=1 Tax=Papaver somniferum TaxID=3469 RepID=UPI000E6FDE46|nr:uncharacterized protein LOC113284548 isoform X2 [Papaver somniferum]